jgi:uncharacterized membrane protein
LKLPSIYLPTFYGKYEKFATFENVFNVQSQTFKSIERLNCLLLALNGQALRFVQWLPFTAKNYLIALNFLVDRYENKKLTAATNIRQMLGLKSISKDDVEEIRQFVNTVCSN